MRCPMCGGVFITRYEDISWDLANRSDMWRYSKLLPLPRTNFVSLGEGSTPLIRANNLARFLGLREILIKDETRNPTGSFVDRGVSVVVSNIKRGQEVVCPTRGDTGASLAVYAAKASIRAKIYVPQDVDMGKLYIMLLAGAEVRVVPNFLSALYLAEVESREAKIFMETSPLYIEGIKTITYEIVEQLELSTPDAILVPVGSGALIFALWKGFKELRDLGIVDETPKLIGVQVRGADHVVRLFLRSPLAGPSKGTMARDIELFIPELAEIAIQAIRNSSGTMISVDEKKIPEYTKILAQTEGIIAEPSAILPIIAIKELLEKSELSPDMRIVAVVTGSGLRTPNILRGILPIESLLRRVIGEPHTSRLMRIGETKIQILKILGQKPQHGYGIRKELLKQYNKRLSMPTIYQHLKELESMGLVNRIEKKGKKRKVIYILTKKGIELINQAHIS